MSFQEDLRKRILILDGAMGTMIQAAGVKDSDNERLNITQPELIRSIHNAYIEAGADIIETNSFGANSVSQSEFGLASEASAMAFKAAQAARAAADSAGRKVYVAGSVGPTGKSLTLATDTDDPSYREISFKELKKAYTDQISALAKGGSDLIIMETCFDALNTKAAIAAHEDAAPELPVIISVTVSDRSGRTLTGQTMEAFYRSVRHCGNLAAFGINCALGAEQMVPLVREIASFSDLPLIFFPNAGIPDGNGNFPEGPEVIASVMEELASEGLLNIAGGCCGTTPGHISAIRESLAGKAPRTVSERDGRLCVSGLESVSIDPSMNFTNIGERTNVTGSRKFARLISEKKYNEALQVAAAQIEGGASIIDINMDDPMLDSPAEMRTFLRYISSEPAVAKAAVMIDSSNWDTVIEGLENMQGKGIVNSISLKDGEEEFIRKALFIKKMGAAMVVMAFDEDGQAETFSRKTEICGRSYRILTEKAGADPRDIIFDPNIFAVGTGIPEHERFALDYISAVRWIKDNLPGAMTSGGVSNVSFAFRGHNAVREAMHSVFLFHAIKSGLDMAIVNPQMIQIYDNIDPELRSLVEAVILCKGEDATRKLVEHAAKIQESNTNPDTSAADSHTAPADPCEGLSAAVVKGGSDVLETLVTECLTEKGSAAGVIEGPLMKGMEKVGSLFADGKMFLPQVVRSAKVMKDAVSFLQPYLEKETSSYGDGVRKPRYLIATVNGDVHDIGKNITAIVLRCSGFDVTDLGVMVPTETILDKAEEIGADMIGVCGLITPSLRRMEEICSGMAARGMDIPLFVGGAATTDIYTSSRLRPIYRKVFHTADASSAAVAAKKYMNSQSEFIKAEDERYSRLGALVHKSPSRSDKSCAILCPEPGSFEDIPLQNITADTLMPFFDWRMFNSVCGVKAGGCACSLKQEALAVIGKERPNATVCARFYDCVRIKDDVLDCGEFTLPMFRGNESCLADCFTEGRASTLGLFAVRIDNPADPEDLISHAVRVTLAEAASKWIGNRLEERLPEGMKLIMPGIGLACCPDHSLKRDILSQLPEDLGISLTESCAMMPEASICGLVIAGGNVSYRAAGKASPGMIDAYAGKRGMSSEEKNTFLGHLFL